MYSAKSLQPISSRYHIPLLVAYLYVFFNVFLLPDGLYYTILLSPFFLYNSLRRRLLSPYIYFILFAGIYALFHYPLELSAVDYLRSNVLILLHIMFLANCYLYFRQAAADEINDLFKKVIYFNFALVLIACMAFFIPVAKPFFWYMIPLTEGSGIIPRLKLLHSEASTYSLVLSPFALYFFFYSLLQKRKFSWSFLLLILLPLVLSFSMGVCGGLLLAILLTLLCYRKVFFSTSLFLRLSVVFFLGITGIFIWYRLNPGNVVFLRLENIIAGKDTSARGRTFEAFNLARMVLTQYDHWWTGIGPGQFKIIGKYILLTYYQYGNMSEIRVPNACADTLIVYGLSGLILRLLLQVILFFRTGVYRNVFRFSLFSFLFIYQFTGSYFNNLLEWMLWVLVFSGGFAFFDYRYLRQRYSGSGASAEQIP